MHPILKRQLRRLGIAGTPGPEEWQRFVDTVSATYSEYDQDRYTLERSLDISSKEMQHLYASLERRSEAQLARERDRLHTIIRNIGDGVCFLDQDGYVRLTNRSTESILGISGERLVGKHIHDCPILRDKGRIEAFLSQQKGETSLRSDSGLAQHEDRGPIPVSYVISKITRGGNYYGSVILFRDMTEQINTLRELENARSNAERANQAKSEFLSSMSHELRTPMNAILGFAQLLKCGSLDDTQRDEVAEILKAGGHLLELINEVLDLAKIESGHIELSLEPLALDPLIEECLGLIGALARNRGIRLDRGGCRRAIVRADPIRLKQALLNLLSNAIKYNRDCGSVRIEIQALDTQHIRINVVDTGIGIPKRSLSTLFQPFNRLDADSRGIEGTGIGLALTRRIVELMGGRVNVESQDGQGSRFWIDLPSDSPADGKPPGDVAHPEPDPASRVDTRRTLLYVEDNPANLKLVQHIVDRRKDLYLLSATTAELGIELARNHVPDLILLDINLPGMNGYQALRVLKADPLFVNTPVVAITASATAAEIERGKAAGFTAYLTKPINVTEFLAFVEICLGQTDPAQAAGRTTAKGLPKPAPDAVDYRFDPDCGAR